MASISLQQAIDYSKANPTSSYAEKIGTAIKSGSFDQIAQQQGVDLSPYGRPAATPKTNPDTNPETHAPANLSLPSVAKAAGGVAGEVGSTYMSDIGAAKDKMVSSVTEGADALGKDQGKPLSMAKDLGETGLGTAAGAVQAIFAPLAAPLQVLLSHAAAGNAQIGDTNPGTKNIVNSPQADAARQQISAWMQQHPEMAKVLGDTFTVGTAALGSGALDTSVSDVAQGVKNTVTGAVNKISDAVTPEVAPVEAKTAVTPALDAAKTQASIDAVNPNLKGNKLLAAVKQTATGKREITPASIFKEEGLTPDQQTINLGTRLADLGLGKDASQNMNILGKALEDTEGKLDTALDGDPELNFNADKPALFQKLNDIKTNSPEEFRVKESQAMVNRVVDFVTKKIVAPAEDNARGIRTGRTLFDSQVKKEFPNAFNPDGTVNVKTPAGYAIKAVRDTMNKHLYETAPNGSEIQTLIGREADIYRAIDRVAPQAQLNQGKTSLQQWAEANPRLAHYLKIGGVATGGAFIGHELGI